MYKIIIKRPCYLSEEVFITPDNRMVTEFLGDKLCDLTDEEDNKSWSVIITSTDIKYLGECLD